MKLYRVVAKVFRVRTPLDLFVAAHSPAAAVQKVRDRLNAGRLTVNNDRVVPAPTPEDEHATAVVVVRERLSGYLEHAEAEEVHHTAYHPARWDEHAGKFRLTCPRPYWYGRRLADTYGSAFSRALFASRYRPALQAAQPAPAAVQPAVQPEPQAPAASLFADPAPVAEMNALAAAHAQADFSPRCKSHAAKLKARLKADKPADPDAYAAAYAQEWERVSQEHAANKPAKKKKAKADTAAA